MRSILLITHRWAGLTIALAMIVTGLTGAILPFQRELRVMLAPAVWKVEPPAATATTLSGIELARQVEDQTGGTVSYIQLVPDPDYAQSIFVAPRHGANCTGVSCGNPRLLRYVMEEAGRAGVPAPVAAQARAALEQAMGRAIEEAASELEAFARRNDARADTERAANREVVAGLLRAPSPPPVETAQPEAAAPRTPPASPAPPASDETVPTEPNELRGQVMTEEDRTRRVETPERVEPPVLSPANVIWPAALFLLLLFGWRARETRLARAA